MEPVFTPEILDQSATAGQSAAGASAATGTDRPDHARAAGRGRRG